MVNIKYIIIDSEFNTQYVDVTTGPCTSIVYSVLQAQPFPPWNFFSTYLIRIGFFQLKKNHRFKILMHCENEHFINEI